jgi:D-alanyl-D-alanine carboxypeptidase
MTEVCVALLLLTFAGIARAGASDELIHQVNQDVRMVLRRTETPGASILALRDGRVIYRKAFGLRELERRLPARMDTEYEIGSITKQFTAAAILQLQDEGKLKIDEKVSAYLPDVPHANEVTLRQHRVVSCSRRSVAAKRPRRRAHFETLAGRPRPTPVGHVPHCLCSNFF